VRDKKEKTKPAHYKPCKKIKEEKKNNAANYIKTYKTGWTTTNLLHHH
jgi:hypothetical protein